MNSRRNEADCNLAARENPFATEQVESLPFRFANGDWPTHLNRLRAINSWGAIVGPQGSGKTTLLLELKRQLLAQPIPDCKPSYYFVSRNRRERGQQLEHMLASADAGNLLLVDGLERFNWLHRRRLLNRTRTGGGLVAAVHRHSRLPTWIECHTDWSLMRHLLVQLVSEPPERLIERTRILFDQRQGNVREVLRDLYDDFAAHKV